LVGIAYYSLATHFQWKISGQRNFLILFLIFAFLDNYPLPMFLALDATITVRNPDIAQWLDLRPDQPLIELFGFGWFEFITYSIQTLFATYFGNKIFGQNI
jgi:hypothetical protein